MIKFVYSLVAMLLLVLASLPAFAESVTLSWDPPTERVNGDARSTRQQQIDFLLPEAPTRGGVR